MISYESEFPPLGKNSTIFSYSQDPPKVLLGCFDPAVVMQEQEKKGFQPKLQPGRHGAACPAALGREARAALSSSWAHTVACSRRGKRGEQRGP